MHRLLLTLLYPFFLLQLVLSLSPAHLACQLRKSAGESALSGCPNGTIYVSQTDPSANFSSVQEAILSLPETGSAVILIGEGEYFEMVSVSRPGPLTLLGQLDPATALLSGAGNASQRNIVKIWYNLYTQYNISDEQTAILTVSPAPGHSFGNQDFRAYNLNLENLAANYSIAPALVTSITLANASFYGCTFKSWQDTWYTGMGANTFVFASVVYGQTDFLFGFGRAWFQSSFIANRACGGGITAWSGEPGTTNGVYIMNSGIVRSPDASPDTVTDGQCFLGRPWGEYARAIYVANYMDESVNPAGFTAWSADAKIPSTTYYAEFGSHGPGGKTSARVQQNHILSSEEAQTYTLQNVFGGPSWIDYAYQY